MPTALITGASGLLGRQVQRVFQLESWTAVGTGLSRTKPPSIVKLDILDETEIARALDEVKPDVVVHCAANRSPDSCSADPDAARKLNVAATHNLASATSARGIFLIYISTDYVFPGRPGEAPYKATSAPDPPNLYGQTKLEGERAILEVDNKARESKSGTAGRPGRCVVLRVPILYGHAEPVESAVNVLLSQVLESQEIKDPAAKIKMDDYAQRFPTNTEDVARVCQDITKLYLDPSKSNTDLPQILQFSSEEQMTKWQMCQVLGEILGLPLHGLESFKPEDGEQEGVKRPYDCHLDTSVLKELGVDVHTISFRTWWRREIGAFRH